MLCSVSSAPSARKAKVPVWQEFIQQNLDWVNGNELGKKEAEQGEWECVLVEVVGTAHKGTAVPSGIYEPALSTLGDEQSFFCWLLLQLLTFTYQITAPCSIPSCVSAQPSPL